MKIQIFKTYCTNLYCSHLWSNFYVYSLNKAIGAFKQIFRKFFNIKRESITGRMVLYHCNNFDVIRRKAVYSFNSRLDNSFNTLVNVLYQSLFFTNSPLNIQWLNILYCNKNF